MTPQNEKQQTSGKSAAFSGHRHIAAKREMEIYVKTLTNILLLYRQGYRTFYCGMAIGFDLLAAEAFRQAKGYHPDMRLIACVPFIGQDKYYSPKDKIRYAALLDMADEKIVLSKSFSRYAYLRRNDYMLSKADTIIAYLDPSKSTGGTAYTISKAHEQNKDVVNLF